MSLMNPRMSSFDLHVHTIYSKDGLNSPKGLFRLMRRKGLRGIALTEHGYPALRRVIVRDGRFLLPACEFKSSDYGEVIGIFISEVIQNRSFAEIAEDIHDQGGIVVLPHPRDPTRKYTAIRKGLPDDVIMRHVDLIEGINSRCIIDTFNKRAQALAKRLGKPMTAGSDGHTYFEVGNARTWLQDIETADDIYEALKKGRTQITGHSSMFIWHIPTMLWMRIRRNVYDAWRK